jgi:hypothetical protein
MTDLVEHRLGSGRILICPGSDRCPACQVAKKWAAWTRKRQAKRYRQKQERQLVRMELLAGGGL